MGGPARKSGLKPSGRPSRYLEVNQGLRSKQAGLILIAIAEKQQALGQSAKAIVSFRQALDIFDVDPGPDTAVTATCLNKLSLLLLYRDAFHEAEPLMRRALKIREKIYGEQLHPDLAASLGNLGLLYYRLGDYEEAEESLRRALGILDGLASQGESRVCVECCERPVYSWVALCRPGEIQRRTRFVTTSS